MPQSWNMILADVAPPVLTTGAFLLIIIAAIAGIVLLIRYFIKQKTKQK